MVPLVLVSMCGWLCGCVAVWLCGCRVWRVWLCVACVACVACVCAMTLWFRMYDICRDTGSVFEYFSRGTNMTGVSVVAATGSSGTSASITGTGRVPSMLSCIGTPRLLQTTDASLGGVPAVVSELEGIATSLQLEARDTQAGSDANFNATTTLTGSQAEVECETQSDSESTATESESDSGANGASGSHFKLTDCRQRTAAPLVGPPPAKRGRCEPTLNDGAEVVPAPLQLRSTASLAHQQSPRHHVPGTTRRPAATTASPALASTTPPVWTVDCTAHVNLAWPTQPRSNGTDCGVFACLYSMLVIDGLVESLVSLEHDDSDVASDCSHGRRNSESMAMLAQWHLSLPLGHLARFSGPASSSGSGSVPVFPTSSSGQAAVLPCPLATSTSYGLPVPMPLALAVPVDSEAALATTSTGTGGATAAPIAPLPLSVAAPARSAQAAIGSTAVPVVIGTNRVKIGIRAARRLGGSIRQPASEHFHVAFKPPRRLRLGQGPSSGSGTSDAADALQVPSADHAFDTVSVGVKLEAQAPTGTGTVQALRKAGALASRTSPMPPPVLGPVAPSSSRLLRNPDSTSLQVEGNKSSYDDSGTRQEPNANASAPLMTVLRSLILDSILAINHVSAGGVMESD